MKDAGALKHLYLTADFSAHQGKRQIVLFGANVNGSWKQLSGTARALLGNVWDDERSDLPGSVPGDRPVAWSADGRSLWIFQRGALPAPVIELDIASGGRRVARTLVPADTAGVFSITEFAITPDGRAYFYSYRRVLSQLYLVRGLE